MKVHIGDCLQVMAEQVTKGIRYDAIVTDPPYEIGLHGKSWDQTGISFSQDLWTLLFALLKPGGFIVSFAASRLYHRLATAAEDAKFILYPFLTWAFDRGLPKPVNLSELFDREVPDREILGYREGSGYTKANVEHGSQSRTGTCFPIHARYVSPESQAWKGFYYGVNCLTPRSEPILLAQRPIDQPKRIDNVRQWGTGGLNLGALQDRYGRWPSTVFEHAKARRADHGSNHPSVKPVKLMEDLCLLVCPPGGHILDPFAGTGTTGLAASQCGFACTLIERDHAMESVIDQRLKKVGMAFA